MLINVYCRVLNPCPVTIQMSAFAFNSALKKTYLYLSSNRTTELLTRISFYTDVLSNSPVGIITVKQGGVEVNANLHLLILVVKSV